MEQLSPFVGRNQKNSRSAGLPREGSTASAAAALMAWLTRAATAGIGGSPPVRRCRCRVGEIDGDVKRATVRDVPSTPRCGLPSEHRPSALCVTNRGASDSALTARRPPGDVARGSASSAANGSSSSRRNCRCLRTPGPRAMATLLLLPAADLPDVAVISPRTHPGSRRYGRSPGHTGVLEASSGVAADLCAGNNRGCWNTTPAVLPGTGATLETSSRVWTSASRNPRSAAAGCSSASGCADEDEEGARFDGQVDRAQHPEWARGGVHTVDADRPRWPYRRIW